jgi:hypothetical protein
MVGIDPKYKAARIESVKRIDFVPISAKPRAERHHENDKFKSL